MKKKIIITTIIFISLLIALPFVFSLIVRARYQDDIYYLESIDEMNPKRVAIVFGAGINNEGRPSPILSERVYGAYLLYKEGKVEKIIMSGDNSYLDYNEPDAMVKYAISLGVDKNDLQPDYAGRRTFDTCIRAKEIFGVESAILVTQDFHLPRAMFTCNSVGVNVTGLAPDSVNLVNEKYYRFRDIIALAMAYVDIHYRRPEVILGDKIEI
jgi:SanA protein